MRGINLLRRSSSRSGSIWQFGSSGRVIRFSGNLLASLLLTRIVRRRSYRVGRFCFEGSEIVVMFTSALFFRTSCFCVLRGQSSYPRRVNRAYHLSGCSRSEFLCSGFAIDDASESRRISVRSSSSCRTRG